MTPAPGAPASTVTLPPGLEVFSTAPTMIDPTWVALRPADLPGRGYGLMTSALSVGIYSLVETSTALGLPDPADNSTLQRRLTTIVSVWSDDADASAGLADDRAEAETHAEMVFVDDAPVFGDESFVTTFEAPSNDGTAVTRNVSMAMRVGALVVDVRLSDFTGATPSLDELAALVPVLIDRAAAAQAPGAPGLGPLMVRISGDGAAWRSKSNYDAYQAVDGAWQPTSTQSAADVAAVSDFITRGRVVNAYTAQNELVNEDTGASFGASTWISTFANEADATAYLDIAVDNVVSSPGNRSNVTRVDVPGIDEPSVALTWSVPHDGGSRDGVRIWVQSGAAVASVLVERAGGVPFEVVRDLAAVQASCLHSTVPCPELAIPAALK